VRVGVQGRDSAVGHELDVPLGEVYARTSCLRSHLPQSDLTSGSFGGIVRKASVVCSRTLAQGGGVVKGKLFAGAVAAVLIGALVVFGTVLALRLQQSNQPLLRATVHGTASTSQGTLPHAFLKLSTYPDSLAGEHGASGGDHPDWVSYSTTNLWAPAHSLVTVTVYQYDSGGALNNPFFATPRGIEGQATLNGQPFTRISPNDVAHTFTLRSIPGNNTTDLFVSVPFALVPDSVPVGANGYPVKPQIITFSFITGAPGKYQWNCEFPCGISYQSFGGPMSTIGYMAGTMTVG